MMGALAELLSPDILGRVEAIDAGLRRRRRAGGFAISAFLIVTTLTLAGGLLTVTTGLELPLWIALALAFGFAPLIVLGITSRFWIRESREPFRYTCSLAAFLGVPPTSSDTLPWLGHDLRERLSDRIARLSFLDMEPASETEAGEAHVHLAGDYVIRKTVNAAKENVWRYEVTARVRIGGSDAPERLAHPVSFDVLRDSSSGPPSLTTGSTYEQLVERVYFHVASEIYKQIREDVERKIALLPTAYLRATAYLHEGDDYARSNTLDAYNSAQELYAQAMQLYGVWPVGPERPRPPIRTRLRRRFRRRKRPRTAKSRVAAARAEIGYASMLLYRRELSGYSGLRINTIFEARPVAENAVKRLDRLARRRRPTRVDASELAVRLFDAQVTLGLAWAYLDAPRKAKEELETAERALPQRAAVEARFLFARALLEPRTRGALALLRRVVDSDGRFEAARFRLALLTEVLWRQRSFPESTMATMVLDAYDEVLRLDPANVQAWANRGYVQWLRGDEESKRGAAADLERGRDYKQIRSEILVADLDRGLTRLAAESGEWNSAYRHYISTVAGTLAQGVAHNRVFAPDHAFIFIGQPMLERYKRYRKDVIEQLDDADRKGMEDPSPRVRRSVRAFVENDYGEACFNRYARTGDELLLRDARDAYRRAQDASPDYVMPHYNLALLHYSTGDLHAALEASERVGKLEPEWPDGILLAWRLLALTGVEAVAELTERRRETAPDEESPARRIDLRGLLRGASLDRWRRPEDAPEPTQSVAAKLGVSDELSEISPVAPEVERLKRLEALHEERDTKRLHEELSLAQRIDPKKLVPHAWLWKKDGELKLKQDQPGLRWEREFDDLHAQALSTWVICTCIGEYAKAGTDKREELERYLDELDLHFQPEDYSRLQARRRLAEDEPTHADLGARICGAIEDTLMADPTDWWWLDELVGEGFGTESHRIRLLEAVEGADLSPALSGWLAAQLEALATSKGDPTLWQASRAAYSNALESDYESESTRAEWRLGAERAAWALGAVQEATGAFEGLDAGGLEPGANWRLRTVKELLALPQTTARNDGPASLRRWLLRSHRDQLDRGDPTAASDAAAALLRLAGVRAGITDLEGRRTVDLETLLEASPVVPSLAVETNPGLFPAGEDTPELRHIRESLDAVRQRIQEEYGVSIPDIAIRGNDELATDEVTLLLHDVPVVRRSLRPGEGRDTHGQLVRQVEELARASLKHFVGLDEQELILARWASGDREREAQLEQVLTDDEARLRLLTRIHERLSRGESIADVGALLAAVAGRPHGLSPEHEYDRAW